MLKYKIRKDLSENKDGVTLYRIEKVSTGELGGYIESEKNLSQEGLCWIGDDAQVYGNAEVSGNAQVSGKAKVYGEAWVYGKAWVSGNAQVSGKAKVYGEALVSGNAQVYGKAWVYGEAKVYGEALVSDDAQVYGKAWVCGNAVVASPAHLAVFHVEQYGITITPQNVAIGCQIKERTKGKVNPFLAMTKAEATSLGLKPHLFKAYKELLRAGLKLVKIAS